MFDSLLQDGVLELLGEVKDGGYVQQRDDELCFCGDQTRIRNWILGKKFLHFIKIKLWYLDA